MIRKISASITLNVFCVEYSRLDKASLRIALKASVRVLIKSHAHLRGSILSNNFASIRPDVNLSVLAVYNFESQLFNIRFHQSFLICLFIFFPFRIHFLDSIVGSFSFISVLHQSDPACRASVERSS